MQRYNTNTPSNMADGIAVRNVQAPTTTCYLDGPPVVFQLFKNHQAKNVVVCIGPAETVYDMHILKAYSGFFHQSCEQAKVYLPDQMFQGNTFEFIYSWMLNMHGPVLRGQLNKLREAAAFLELPYLVKSIDYELGLGVEITAGTSVPYKSQAYYKSSFEAAGTTAGLQNITPTAGHKPRTGFRATFTRAPNRQSAGNWRSSDNWRRPANWRKPALNPDAPSFVPSMD